MKSTRSGGAISDLESQVQPDWWRHIFNATYLTTDADIVGDPGILREEVDLISDILEWSPQDMILDLCCGQGRHSLDLARRGFPNVTGLDYSRYLIQQAAAQSAREALHVRFVEGDARDLPYPPSTFDVTLILGNSFGYFETMHDDQQVLREVFRILRPRGRLLLDIADGGYLRGNFQLRSWEWIDHEHLACRERCLSRDQQRLISREMVIHVEAGVIVDQFYAQRLYTLDSLSQMLESAGLDIAFHRETSSPPRQDRDLGMMAKRLVITAVPHK